MTRPTKLSLVFCIFHSHVLFLSASTQAFIQQLAAASTANNAAAVNSMPATNGSANVQSNSDLSNSQPSAQELAMAQQRFMMMMLMYQQAMQTQSALP